VLFRSSTPAWEFYSKYIQNHLFKHLIQLGLTLRSLENDEEKLQKLRTRIVRAYGTKELHIAEFIASKTLSKYIASRIDVAKSNQDLIKDIENIFNNIDRDYIFIQTKDKAKNEADAVISYLKGSLPELIILVSKGSAIKICKQIIEMVETKVSNYEIEIASTDERQTPEEKREYVAFIRLKSIAL
jgi:hypothetical protein